MRAQRLADGGHRLAQVSEDDGLRCAPGLAAGARALLEVLCEDAQQRLGLWVRCRRPHEVVQAHLELQATAGRPSALRADHQHDLYQHETFQGRQASCSVLVNDLSQ